MNMSNNNESSNGNIKKRISMANMLDEEDKIEVEPKTFYITPEQSKQLAIEKAIEGKDLSTIVRQAIEYYFVNKEEAKKYFNEK